MKKRNIKKLISIIAFMIVAITGCNVAPKTKDVTSVPKEKEINKQTIIEDSSITLQKCTDGDTARFSVNGEERSVRFLAIDTPETVKPNTPVEPYGKEASKTTCGLLSNANNIYFEYEENNKEDKYNRLLAWVFVDGKLLQEILLENGYAEIKYADSDYKYLNILYKAQDKAIAEKKGIWQ